MDEASPLDVLMIRAAIYARKSKEQKDAEDVARSVNRQVENARVFAIAKGWVVVEDQIYVDDGISGASAPARLEDKARMLTAILSSEKQPFEVLICQDQDRFSRRDGDESFAELKAISKAGVQVWFYVDGSRFQFGDFASNTLSFLKGEFAAEYRRAISQKTHESHHRKAQLGHVTGGLVFGYDNVEIDKHVERVPNPVETAVVQRIFALCAAGNGYSRISKLLNKEFEIYVVGEDGEIERDQDGKIKRIVDPARCPKPRRKGAPAGWSPSTVRDVLHRELYRGVLLWNRTKKRDRSGDVAPSHRDPSEHVRVQRDDLAIVSADEWNAAHARIQRVRASQVAPAVERLVRGRDRESSYLLAGFARCASCGGTLSVLTRQHGKHRVPFYGCLAYHKRGPSVCRNALVLPVTRVDDAVLRAFAGNGLEPEVITVIIDAVFAALEPEHVEGNVAALKEELDALNEKIRNLTLVSAQGGADIPSVIAQLRDWHQEREGLVEEIAAAKAINKIHADRAEVECKVQAQVGRWRELAASAVVGDGRQLLNEMLEGPLRFTPDGKTYKFAGPVVTGRMIAGMVFPPNVASPRGRAVEWKRVPPSVASPAATVGDVDAAESENTRCGVPNGSRQRCITFRLPLAA
jgi:DNA invertase Pin-like site-specific DNA recombinase/chorismate mutase